MGREQKELLLESRVVKVIENIAQLAGQDPDAHQLTKHYQGNAERMDYKRYRQMGCGIIGSGAIEPAHRTVVQSRMKQSGQRRSIKGAQHMLNLRVTRMNGQWANVI